jgi:hypothetical protein
MDKTTWYIQNELDIIHLVIQNEPVKPGFVKHMDKTTWHNSPCYTKWTS